MVQYPVNRDISREERHRLEVLSGMKPLEKRSYPGKKPTTQQKWSLTYRGGKIAHSRWRDTMVKTAENYYAKYGKKR
jgi:hypothetical protein